MAGQPTANPVLTFDVTGLTVNEPGLAPTTVIEDSADFEFNVSFEFGGFFAPFLVGLGIPCNVTVRFESLGDGPEGVEPQPPLPPVIVTTVAGILNYVGTIPVPATDLLSTVGTYRLVGVVVVPGSPIAGFTSGVDILQIIEG